MTEIILYNGQKILLINGVYYFQGVGRKSLKLTQKAIDNYINNKSFN